MSLLLKCHHGIPDLHFEAFDGSHSVYSKFNLQHPLLVRGWGAKHSLSSPTLWTFRNFGRSSTNPMESEAHYTALCKRIKNCNLLTMSYQLHTRMHKVAINDLWKPLFERFVMQCGGKWCWHAIFTKIHKSAQTQKVYEAHNQTLAHFYYVQTAPCAASKKQKAERLANAKLIFAFAQLRDKLPKNSLQGPGNSCFSSNSSKMTPYKNCDCQNVPKAFLTSFIIWGAPVKLE